MKLDIAKGLLASLIDERAAEHDKAELDMAAAVELCRIAIRYCWLKA